MIRSDLCIQEPTEHNSPKPRRGNDRFRSKRRLAGLSLCTVCTFVLFVSCNSSKRTISSDSPLGSGTDSSLVENGADTPAVKRPEIVTGPMSAKNREAGLTIGERLKHIDSLMQTAPPDSLGILMAEYERLLDSATSSLSPQEPPRVESSTPLASQETGPTTEPSYPRSTPRSSLNGDSHTLVQSDYEGKGEDSAFDPTNYHGARESELEYYRENRPSETTTTPSSTPSNSGTPSSERTTPTVASATPAPSSSKTKAKENGKASKGKKSAKKGKGKAKGKKGKATRDEAPAIASTSPKPASREKKAKASSSLEENYTEGLAQFRAGNYNGAITNLKPVANSSNSSWRTTARYYLALSLERTGSHLQAATQFKSLMSGSGSFADKSWLGYCRVLTSQGKKGEAKKELLRFIAARPGSSQIATARQMLQKL